MSKVISVIAGTGELELKERKIPKGKGRNIVVEVYASSMNPHDWKFYGWFKGFYKNAAFIPDLLLGHDLSGVVIDVGDKVSKFKVGDEVYAMSAKTGAFGEHVALDERMAALKPENLNHEEAASVPMAALTAWQAFILTKLKAGDEILVIGGSGGVGIFAIQLAKSLGAKVTTVCSTANVDLVKSLGADFVVDYKKEDYHDLDKRFDVVFDVIGGQSKESCASILKEGAHFISTNTSAKNIAEVFASRVNRFRSEQAVSASTFLAMPIGRHLEKISDLIEKGEVKTLVDKVFLLAETEVAMGHSKLGRTKGKIVLKVK
jgi:alcohol dehydrogenase